MPRPIWKGAISFGLITIPVKLYGATETKDVAFHQVHAADSGRIRYKRVCEKDGQEVPYSEIAKGYEAPDGRVVVLTAEDFESLPLSSSKAVEIVQFVNESDIDPVYFEKSYYIEAETVGVKPYVLLRDALARTGRSAVVKVALRSRESLGLIRAKGNLLVLDTMLWPDEVRDSQFAAPSVDVTATTAEVGMAEVFIEQLSGQWQPDDYQDNYRSAVEELVNAKLAGVPLPEPTAEASAGGEVIDLVAALKASVEAAKKRREATAAAGDGAESTTSSPTKAPAKRRKQAS